ncbi:MAG TPA: SpoIID/LytB domain-containing protein [Terriglobia bacterium]|nr:SpoIID/LytB domain-containing protein [Terriglobia bacterium]
MKKTTLAAYATLVCAVALASWPSVKNRLDAAGLQTYAGLGAEPTVRIGLNQDAATVTVRSDQPFTVEKQRARSVKVSTALTIGAGTTGPVSKSSLESRAIVELDDGRVLVLPTSTKIRMEPGSARLDVGGKTYRGVIEIFGNSKNSFTVVNELPLEDYLLGVVPNELSPITFGQLEALKAQSVAARTYIVRNLGQYNGDGFDICNTDACQVYNGASTEHPLSSQAVRETRGAIAIYGGRPINALYSSTCGGRTENAENIFQDKTPYLVSTLCEYKHPEPHAFAAGQVIADYDDAVLRVAGVANYTDLGRFLGIKVTAEPRAANREDLARFIRSTFYPTVKVRSDLEFLAEQGILSMTMDLPTKTVLNRVIDKKSAFEWQQGVLTSWDGQTMNMLVGNQPRTFRLGPQAPIFARVGDDRVAMKDGTWIGGELFDFRAAGDVIQFAVYRRNYVNPTADRYSRLAQWQTHKTRQEIDTAFQPLNIGAVKGMRVIERGPSERPIRTEISGTRGAQIVRALRLRSLLGLRDSLFYFDEERNANGELLGISFFGTGWGHGVGMCQVGAFGMALDGATFDQILKKYYQGIDIAQAYR